VRVLADYIADAHNELRDLALSQQETAVEAIVAAPAAKKRVATRTATEAVAKKTAARKRAKKPGNGTAVPPEVVVPKAKTTRASRVKAV